MSELFGDARLEELMLLSEIDRHGALAVKPTMPEARRDMIIALAAGEYVADPQSEWVHRPEHEYFKGLPGESGLERTLYGDRIRLLSRAMGKQDVRLKLTHKGRVRLSELKQSLRAGREREPFGILWDARHWEQDLQIAVVDAAKESPLAVAYLDMNGLKQVNDAQGHDAGDLALRAYFQAVLRW